MNPSLLSSLAKYNAYANRIMVETTVGLDPEDLDKAPNLSHNSGFKLIRHLLVVEAHYLAQCQSISTEVDNQSLSTIEGLGEVCARIGDEMQEFTNSLNVEKAQQIKDVNIGGHKFRFPIWQLLLQVFMHSAHHRGELSVLLTSLGRQPPIEDIIVQLAEESGQQWPWKSG